VLVEQTDIEDDDSETWSMWTLALEHRGLSEAAAGNMNMDCLSENKWSR